MFEHFHMHVSYPKTLTKMDICSECMLSFRTLNEHILLVKRDYEIIYIYKKVITISLVPEKTYTNHSFFIVKDFLILCKLAFS